jgi:hypothetical protein
VKVAVAVLVAFVAQSEQLVAVEVWKVLYL